MNKAIEEIMENFNFDKVYSVMKHLKWEWRGEPVTLGKIVSSALVHLLAVESDTRETSYYSSGGFEARKEKGHYCLSFTIEEWDADLSEEELT